MQLRFRALQIKHMDTKSKASSPHSTKKQMGTHLPKCLVKYLRLQGGNSTTLEILDRLKFFIFQPLLRTMTNMTPVSLAHECQVLFQTFNARSSPILLTNDTISIMYSRIWNTFSAFQVQFHNLCGRCARQTAQKEISQEKHPGGHKWITTCGRKEL